MYRLIQKENEVDKTIMVPLPERLLPEFYEWVAQRAKPTRAEPPVGNTDWTAEEIRDAYITATRGIGLILGHLADCAIERPDGRVSIDELAKVTYGPNGIARQIGGALSSFTKTVKRKYGKETWPFKVARIKETGVVEYWMHPEVAEIIKDAKGS
jgi:hypothetical protein